jgi:hypothetical protein
MIRQAMRSGRRAVDGSVRGSLSAATAPPGLSAVCDWYLPSQLFSPDALDSSPDRRVRFGPSELRRHLLLYLSTQVLTASALPFDGEVAEARPVLAWCWL